METAETALSDKEKKAFYDILFPMMEQNMQRLSDDLDWFCDKFDYRNKDADWRTSKDALPRGMQKAAGGYPADEPYTMDKLKSKPQAVLKLSAQPAAFLLHKTCFQSAALSYYE